MDRPRQAHDPDWIELPPGWPAELGRPRGAEADRPPVVVASPLRPMGGGVRRRVVRLTGRPVYRSRARTV